MAETNDAQAAVKTLNEKSSSKKSIGVIALVVGLIVIAGVIGGIFAYVNQGKNSTLSFIPTEVFKNPDERVKESFDQSVDESIKSIDKMDLNNLSVDSLLLNSKGQQNSIGLKVKTDDNKLDLSLYLDAKADKDSKRLSADANLNIIASTGSSKIEFKDINLSAVLSDNKGYIQLKSLPTDILSLAGVDSSLQDKIKSDVIGKWILIDPNTLKSNGLDLSKAANSSYSNLSKDDLKKILEEAKKYRFFKNSKLIGRETVNGYSTIHYKSELNFDELKSYAKALPTKVSGNISDVDSQSIDKLFDNLKTSISSYNVDLYIGVSDNFVYKESHVFSIKKGTDFTKDLESDVKVELNIETKEKDKSQKIDVPTDAKDIIDVAKSFAQ